MPTEDIRKPHQITPRLDDPSGKQQQRIRTTKPDAYIPGFPLKVLLATVDADAVKALPLVLAIHRQLTMTRRQLTPLNGAIWKAAGNPSHKERETILAKIKMMPDVIRIECHRTATAHYRVGRGGLWSV